MNKSNVSFSSALVCMLMMVVVLFRVGNFEDDENHVKAEAQPAKQLGRQSENMTRSQFLIIYLDLIHDGFDIRYSIHRRSLVAYLSTMQDVQQPQVNEQGSK
jgi:hypothetical protein